MSKPLIALVGRPNVGKSALFNRLARHRIAIVEDFEGTTRDRLYTDIDIWGRQCTLIDTGGFDNIDKEGYTPAILDSTQIGIEQADLIIFLTDGREEPTTLDFEIADVLRKTRKPIIVAANKIDQPHMKVANHYDLRLGEVISMSAMGGYGVAELTERVEDLLPPAELDDAVDETIKIALVGRPNVGKSQLTNTILGYERSIVSPVPGTTRDAVDTFLSWGQTPVTLIDTAGMRRKARVKAEKTAVEYHMVLRSLRAIDRADVVIVMIEAGGITDQDTKIAGYAHEAGKPMVVAVNKWDLIEKPTTLEKRTKAQKDFEVDLKNYLPFVSYAPIHYLSGLNNWGVEEIIDDAIDVSKNGSFRVTTGQLNDIIRRAVAEHPIPSVKGRPVKIRYATQFGINPPSIAVFVNQPDLLHFSYVRRIENVIRAKFPFRGVPLKIEVRKSNPRDEKFEKHD
ncbi:GTP-binding protein [Abditibacterium utsteinense]|uniref:GTPase Der n=1 Tax=Abditibacterium utsteinense TaxID=1960156 RepID=A0A2S8SQA5_9BACT|nr:ribosome biogenesis GTPase Der [Abditibacterium utsteinense]PQV62984.1 GTP-binding protein [Abditibacterium utsteinense]